MPIEEQSFHAATCDYPGCVARLIGSYDEEWFGSLDSLCSEARDMDWLVIVDTEDPDKIKLWCEEHYVVVGDGDARPAEAPSEVYDWGLAVEHDPMNTYVTQATSEYHARGAQNLSDDFTLYRRVHRDGPPAVSERAGDHGWERVDG